MSDLDLAYTPATQLAQMIREKKISPVEVVANSLKRIEQVNPVLNAFCFTYEQEALERAKQAEDDVMAGRDLGPLHGVPVAIKDFTPTKGKVTTRGSALLRDWVPDFDPVLVQRLFGAGAIMVGKTATPELASSGFTSSPLWGVTHNPWNVDKNPGGSSGGSGAAVASGCVPLAEGTDMGGSVRLPASFCGTVGLKPSLGRIPMDIVGTCFDNITHFGPLARTVSDAALFIDVGQGVSPVDIQSLPRCDMPVPVPTDVRGMRVALDVDMGFYAVEDDVRHNLQRVADALRDAGAIVDEVNFPMDHEIIGAVFGNANVYLATMFVDLFGNTLDEKRDDMDPNLIAMVEDGLRVDAVTAKRWEMVRTRFWGQLSALHEDYDALLCPTTTMTAQPVGARDADYDWSDDDGRYHAYDITGMFNLVASCPALSVPSGFSSDGLPTSAQVIGRKWDDAGTLRIGAAIEQALPWSDRRPDI